MTNTNKWMSTGKDFFSLLKTSDGRTIAISKGKEALTKGRKLIIETWKRGSKGKVKICSIAVLIILALGLVFSSTGKDSPQGKYFLSKKDLKTITGGDELCYKEKNKMVPNLKKLPAWYKDVALGWALIEGKLVKGEVYYVGEKSNLNDFVVVHAEENGVIAERGRGKFVYIKTNEDYCEGDILKEGLYACVGTKVVPLANGSSRKLYALNMLSTDVSDAVVSAMQWNESANEATEEANKLMRHDRLVKCVGDKIKSQIDTFSLPPAGEIVICPKHLLVKPTAYVAVDGWQTGMGAKLDINGYKKDLEAHDVVKMLRRLHDSETFDVDSDDKVESVVESVVNALDRWCVKVTFVNSDALDKEFVMYEVDMDTKKVLQIKASDSLVGWVFLSRSQRLVVIKKGDESLLKFVNDPEGLCESAGRKYK